MKIVQRWPYNQKRVKNWKEKLKSFCGEEQVCLVVTKKYYITLLTRYISVDRMMEYWCHHSRLIGSQVTSELLYRGGIVWPRYAENLCLCFLCLDKFVSVKTCSDMTFSGRRQDCLNMHSIRCIWDTVGWLFCLDFSRRWAVTPSAITSHLS